MKKKITPFKLKTTNENMSGNLPVSRNIFYAELDELKSLARKRDGEARTAGYLGIADNWNDLQRAIEKVTEYHKKYFV